MRRTGGFPYARHVKCAKYLDWTVGGSAAQDDTTLAVAGLTPVTFSGDIGNATPTIHQNFCAIARQVGVTGREMDCVKLKSIYFDGFASSSAGVATDIYFRVMLIQDRQANGAVTSVSSVFDNDTTLCGSTKVLNEASVRLRMENRYRYKTLYDKTYKLVNTAGATANGYVSSKVKFYIKFAKPLELQYDTNVSSVGDDAALRSNNINMFAVCNDPLGARANAILSGILRLRFADGE
jgi:hypothetical protein